MATIVTRAGKGSALTHDELDDNATNLNTELTSTTTLATAALPKTGGAMTGAITTNSTFDGVDIATRDGVLTTTTTTANAALPKSGGTMTGNIIMSGTETVDGVDISARDSVLTSTTTTANAALPKTGGAMTGAITTNSTFDGVDIATRDGVLTSTTATANSALQDVVSDTSPQLGGNLDVNGNDIVTTSNGDIELDPNGSGLVKFKGNATKGSGQFVLNCEANSHGITIKGPPHSAGANYTLTLPNNDGDADQVLTTDGSGVLTWTTAGSGTVTGYTNGTDNRVITSSGTTTINGEANLTFNGSTLGLTGDFTVSGTVDGVDIATRDAVLTSTTTTANAALPKTGGAMTGAITTNSTFDGVDIATRDGVLTTTTTTANAALPKTGGAMTGAITTNSTFDGVDIATRDGVLTSTTTTANAALPKAGGTMSGAIAMGTSKITGMGDPTANQDAATKAYVDSEVSSGTVTPSSTNTFTNKTIDANGTGNSITNLEVADLASGVLDTDLSSVSGSDDTLASAKAIKTYVDASPGTVTGYTNGTDNRVITSSGSTTLNGEANFTFDGSNAVISGSAGGLTSPILELVTDNSGYNRPQLMFKDSNADVWSMAGRNQTNTGAEKYQAGFTLDPNNTHGRTGVSTYAGDYFVGFNKNYADQSAISMDMAIFGANAGFNIAAFDDGGGSYGYRPINLKGNAINLMPGGSAVALTSTSDTLSINTNVEISDTVAIKFEDSGTLKTQIDKDEITAKGSFKINVDSDNSGNEAFTIQSAGTDVMSFQRGPGNDAEMTIKGDGLFIKDEDSKTQFSMDMSNATVSGVKVFRTNENKALTFSLKTDDNDDTGNYDGSWNFRQNADEKSMILEREDGATVVNIFEIRDSADVATANPTDIFEFKIPPVVPSYAVGSLPTTVVAGAQALATGCNSSDVSTGKAMCWFDGTNWKYTHLPATTVRT